MKKFMDENFLLGADASRVLYHEYATQMPIFDFHSHLPSAEIAENRKYRNLTEIWLSGDHYKWRLMRANGIPEDYCTGRGDDFSKFRKWAETLSFSIRNPLYHWSHLESQHSFLFWLEFGVFLRR